MKPRIKYHHAARRAVNPTMTLVTRAGTTMAWAAPVGVDAGAPDVPFVALADEDVPVLVVAAPVLPDDVVALAAVLESASEDVSSEEPGLPAPP